MTAIPIQIEPFQDTQGNARTGLPVTLTAGGTLSPALTLYTDSTGGTTRANPFTTDSNGLMPVVYIDPANLDSVSFVVGGALYRTFGFPNGFAAKGSIVTATNASGTTTATGSVISTLVDVPSTGLTVPANTQGDVWLEYQGDFLDGGTTGVGLLCLIETTSGSVLRSSVVAKIVNDASVGSFPQKAFQLGTITTARSFKLQIQFITTGAQFSMLNSTTNPTYLTCVSR